MSKKVLVDPDGREWVPETREQEVNLLARGWRAKEHVKAKGAPLNKAVPAQPESK